MLADISHFSMVGFPLEASDGDVLWRSAGAQLAAGDNRGLTTCLPAPGGNEKLVCVVRDPSGGELWYGLDGEGAKAELITLNPAFAGAGRANLKIDGDVSDPDWRPFEITLHARFSGEETPIVFDLADPEQAGLAKPGADVTVSLAAFSFAPDVFRNEKAYYAAQRKAGFGSPFAPNAFVPSGLFGPGTTKNAPKRPEPEAFLAGTILKAELRSNDAGGGKFWAVLARSYGGMTVDVVIDPKTIKIEPKPGYIVTGSFWLTGRIVPSP